MVVIPYPYPYDVVMKETKKVLVYSAKTYERPALELSAKKYGVIIEFLEERLTEKSVALAQGSNVISIFVNDCANAAVLKGLVKQGVRAIALRSAGFNHVDLKTAKALGLRVYRVPAYSPHAVAEHATALLLCLNRKLHKAYNRVREGNFNLEGLVGFDLHGKTVGIIGFGKIGSCFADIMHGFGAKVLGYDRNPKAIKQRRGLQRSSLEILLKNSDIVSLHCPLTEETKHIINKKTLSLMKSGAVLINTGRGALVDTKALIQTLKAEKLGAVGLDVYEEEENLFFRDLSSHAIEDDVFARLLTFPNVLITGHQAFLTEEALLGIAQTTLKNIRDFYTGTENSNVL